MMANPILLQKKYSRVIECFAKRQGISLDAALVFFITPMCISWFVTVYPICTV